MSDKQKKSEESKNLTRRQFFLRTTQAGTFVLISGALAELLESCNVNDPQTFNEPILPVINASGSSSITLTIDSSSPLAAVGSAALVRYSGGSLLVAHTAQSSFVAVTAICTHQGCEITGYSNQTYTCACHGSQFDTSGQVVRGPAQTALRSYATAFSNNQLTITLA